MCSQRCCETLKAQLICQAQGNVLSADRAAVGDLAFKAYRMRSKLLRLVQELHEEAPASFLFVLY